MSVADQGIAKSAWADLMVQHGHATDANLHNSRHGNLEYVTDLASNAVDLYCTIELIDGAMGFFKASAEFIPSGLGDSEEAVGATAGLASGLLGSIFSA